MELILSRRREAFRALSPLFESALPEKPGVGTEK